MAAAPKVPRSLCCPPPHPLTPHQHPVFLSSRTRRPPFVQCAARRTGRRRYPTEKRELERRKEELLSGRRAPEDRTRGVWRLSRLAVPARDDPGKDFVGVHPPLLAAIAKVLEFPVASMLPEGAFTVVRKSFDARKVLKEPQFVYIVDMDVQTILSLEPRTWDFISHLEAKLGVVEYMPEEKSRDDLIATLQNEKERCGKQSTSNDKGSNSTLINGSRKPKVAVVGSGPSGLFAALVLRELGANVTLIERGQPVEQRGRDIGALIVRKILQSESNFCFGEGGAGTWSDGKLVTRIGRNSESVQAVLRTLVHFGAPESILIHGKPHLGTDRLVPLLRNFRQYLKELGVKLMFGSRVDDLIIDGEHIKGLTVSDAVHPDLLGQKLSCDAVVLGVGHSARDVYSMLFRHNVDVIPKDFAVGLRIEHPQELINSIQYSELASEVHKGRGRVPVADYKIVKYLDEPSNRSSPGSGDEWSRSCYSFCMCPGGQVVLTSTTASELCINGMSFSRRASRWANSALVVTVSSHDFEDFRSYGAFAGIEFQREFERRAAVMGGGGFVVPAQCVTDFLDSRLSVTSLPPSSYRLGVKACKLHEIYPPHITEALQRSIEMFNSELPGFITKEALLHGVETRTSSPVKIKRHSDTYESTSLKGLYPVGEGAGYAGGIVSAAVDGMRCGFAAAKALGLYHGDADEVFGKADKQAGVVKY